ncbi:MAG: hypothetical protein HYV45_00220 [Candidatus Moranbacteria bacterium]|nr:hypothetical protein [Candidatus Moranbacteria bacterium]
MSWTFVALAGYFFNAVAALFDKYLLADRIKAPAVYAFFVSLFSLFALVFVPFGFQFFSWYNTFILLCSGFLFLYGLVAFYVAVKGNEISRVAPLVGTVVSLTALLVVFFPSALEMHGITSGQVFSLFLLIAGGLLLSFDLPLRRDERIPGLVLVAGVLMAFSLLLLKYGYAEANFASGLVWSRLGIFLGGLTLLFVPSYRKHIFADCCHFSKPTRFAIGTGAIFVVNKICAGVGSFLIAYATFLGPVAFVQALSGMQYVFLLVLALPLAARYPFVFDEKLFFWDWFQKIFAITLIATGIWIASMSGIKLLTI